MSTCECKVKLSGFIETKIGVCQRCINKHWDQLLHPPGYTKDQQELRKHHDIVHSMERFMPQERKR